MILRQITGKAREELAVVDELERRFAAGEISFEHFADGVADAAANVERLAASLLDTAEALAGS